MYNQQISLVRGTGRRVLVLIAHHKYAAGQCFTTDELITRLGDFFDDLNVNRQLVELAFGQLARLGFLRYQNGPQGITYEITQSGKDAADYVFARARRGDTDFAQMIPATLREQTSASTQSPLSSFSVVAELGARWQQL